VKTLLSRQQFQKSIGMIADLIRIAARGNPDQILIEDACQKDLGSHYADVLSASGNPAPDD
jgi:hypothetical protein